MQNQGSFKIRGVAHQVQDEVMKIQAKGELSDISNLHLVTMSAGTKFLIDSSKPKPRFISGNYGRAFAHSAQKLGFQGTVCMPNAAPKNRSDLIKSWGLNVEKGETSQLMDLVAKVKYEIILPLRFNEYSNLKLSG